MGQKKRGKLWRLGKEGIKEVEDYKYLGVCINRQVNGHNHVNHLKGKALGLQNLARGEKFWGDKEDIKAGLTMWEVVRKPVLNHGAEVWACSCHSHLHFNKSSCSHSPSLVTVKVLSPVLSSRNLYSSNSGSFSLASLFFLLSSCLFPCSSF